jgi:hypothetical protein
MESGATQHVERGAGTCTAWAADELGALRSVMTRTKGKAGQLGHGYYRSVKGERKGGPDVELSS